jgi:uncharacterized protein (DUF433 family)
MDYKELIEIDHNKMLGKPVIKGTRITVELILRELSNGTTIDELLSAYPFLEKEEIFACLNYGADLIANEETLIVSH